MRAYGDIALILYAPNIHQGGGRVLLLPVIECLKRRSDVLFILDERLFQPDAWPALQKLFKVSPTVGSRLRLEWKLRLWVSEKSKILCMGNLPPLLAKQGEQIVFVQNRYLIDDVSLAHFPWRVRVRLIMERKWLQMHLRHVRRFVVQTPTMASLLEAHLNRKATILPFADVGEVASVSSSEQYNFDYIYVASGEPHKNHRLLISAWIELARNGYFPSLCLTLDRGRFSKLCDWIDQQVGFYHLNISLLGEYPHKELLELCRQSRALIYPSTFESFGLPLIEGAKMRMPVLAAQASYVSDVIRPTAQFDPRSVHALAEAVKQFSFQPAQLSVELLTAEMFLAKAMS